MQAAGEGHLHPASGLLVGRQRELEELRAGLEEGISGRGCLFLITGEPGIGKTTLLEELASEAAQRGARAVWGCCWERGGAPPYWPWVQVLRACLPAAASRIGGPGADYARQIVPELRVGAGEEAAAGGGFPLPEAERARLQLFDWVRSFLGSVAAETPLVILLDDLHAADRPSLFLLGFLAGELRRARVVIAGAYRDLEAKQSAVAELLAEIGREAYSLPLRGLREGEVARLIEQQTRAAPAEAVVAAVYRSTEGNPLFVAETVRMLRAEGRLAGAEEPPLDESFGVVSVVREAILRRLQPLEDDHRSLLAVASVIGSEFDIDCLRQVTGLPLERLLGALGELRASEVLVEVSAPLGRYRFSHALVRETLYEALEPARRAALHRDVGQVLESHRRGDPGARLADLAHHFFQAIPACGYEKALDYAARAGDQAMEQLAYEDAAEHYARALEVLEAADGDERRRCELLLALGDAQGNAGEARKSRQALERAAAIAEKLAAPRLLGNAALRIGVSSGWGRFGVVDPLEVRLLESALGALGSEDSELRAALLARLGSTLSWSDAAERRAALSAEAVAMARRLADPRTLAFTLAERHVALWGPETVRERLALTTELVTLAESARQGQLAFQGYVYRLADLLELGDRPAFDRDFAVCARLAEGLRQSFSRWQLLVIKAMQAALEGGLEDGERLAAEALEVGRPVQEGNALQLFGVQIFVIRAVQGRLGELEEAIRDVAGQYPGMPSWRCALALVESELGRTAAARAELERLADREFEAALPRDANWLISAALLAQVSAALGDRARAAVLYERLLPHADRNVVIGPAAGFYGPVARYLALLAAAEGRWQEAERHFEDATSMCARIGAAPFLALVEAELAEVLLARGRHSERERSARLLDAALEKAREIGMQRLVAKIEALRPRAGERVTVETGRVAAATRENVFRREGDFWTIAFEGRAFRMRDMKGLSYIARLLRHPGEEFHAADLVRGPGEPGSAAGSARAELAATRSDLGDAGEVVDARATASYRSRAAELERDLEEARTSGDSERASRAEEELRFLNQELSAAVGLGGRQRVAASASERGRVAVTRAISKALERIAEESPALGRYLEATIRTGVFCSYAPDPDDRVEFVL